MSDIDEEKKASIVYALPFLQQAEDVPENYDIAVYYDAWENYGIGTNLMEQMLKN